MSKFHAIKMNLWAEANVQAARPLIGHQKAARQKQNTKETPSDSEPQLLLVVIAVLGLLGKQMSNYRTD